MSSNAYFEIQIFRVVMTFNRDCINCISRIRPALKKIDKYSHIIETFITVSKERREID